ncbi:hypothetical protein C2G38_2161434 [Gigaspora rosea]|uniref:Uncharacterized protein n=1 Tax=Gigaspora rosea TaxID=44941 RepID=A0A397W1H6_9GLOM|nr:hypothetical protein C2G38_2161434 [Gigaspora rosea]
MADIRFDWLKKVNKSKIRTKIKKPLLSGSINTSSGSTLSKKFLVKNKPDFERGQVLVDTYCKTTAMTSLDSSSSDLGPEGKKALVIALARIPH